MNLFWIYSIECVETGQIYIGQTSKPVPFWRWGDHINALKNNYCRNSLFQEVWNSYSDLKYWRFQALDRVEGKVKANHRESEFIYKIPVNKRLNMSNSSPLVSYEQKQRIEKMIKDKTMGYLIAEEVGVSPSTVSKIKKELMFAGQ